VKIFFIPPWRSSAMSSIESAPATIPATSDDTFNPAFAPLSVRDAQPLIGEAAEARLLGETDDRDQTSTRHEIRVIK